MQHPAVKECCVVGKPDEAGLVKPLAIVVAQANVEAQGSPGVNPGLAHDALANELIQHCKKNMVHYKAPRWVKFSDKPLPRNDRDKIDRKLLRKEHG
jgi:acyl-coenzyme A synthetase/AMP-(fatty) acid ligase